MGSQFFYDVGRKFVFCVAKEFLRKNIRTSAYLMTFNAYNRHLFAEKCILYGKKAAVQGRKHQYPATRKIAKIDH